VEEAIEPDKNHLIPDGNDGAWDISSSKGTESSYDICSIGMAISNVLGSHCDSRTT
jgi:hypothetical protein